jgi:hypothetical protein
MSHDESIDRVRNDLETLRQAAGLDLPFSRDDIRTNLWVAACGALLAGWAALAPWDYRGLVAVPLLLAVAGAVWSARAAHRHRGSRPSPWREHRVGMLAVAVLHPLVAAYMQWEKHLGIPREMAGAAAVFFVGVATLVFGLADRRRVSYLAAAVPLMAYGLVIPLLTRQQVIVAGGVCMTVACLAVAAIQTAQLRRAGDVDGPH